MAKKDFSAAEARRPAARSALDSLRSRTSHPTRVRLHELQPNPGNPRDREEDFDEAVQELAESFKSVGQIQSAVVIDRERYLSIYPHREPELTEAPWVVIVGNRRLAAAQLVDGMTALDVKVNDTVTTAEAIEDRILIENIQRKGLHPLREAAELQRQLDRPGQTLRSVAARIGKSHAYVQQRLQLLKLIPPFQALMRTGDLDIKTARKLGALDADAQHTALAAGPPYLAAAETTAGNPVAKSGPTDEYPGAGNPVTKLSGREEESGGLSAGDRDSTTPAPVPVSPAPAARPESPADGLSAPLTGNPVTTGESEQQSMDEQAEVPDAGNAGDVGGDEARVRATRTWALQTVDSILAQMDQILPSIGGIDGGEALAAAAPHLRAARAALGAD